MLCLIMFIGAVFVNNFILAQFLGLCPFMGTSKKIDTAIGMGFATAFVITLVSVGAWTINNLILIPLDLIYLRILSYILISAVVVQLAEMIMRKTSPHLYRCVRYFPSLNNDKLCCIGCSTFGCKQKLYYASISIFWFQCSCRIYLGHYFICRYARTSSYC